MSNDPFSRDSESSERSTFGGCNALRSAAQSLRVAAKQKPGGNGLRLLFGCAVRDEDCCAGLFGLFDALASLIVEQFLTAHGV